MPALDILQSRARSASSEVRAAPRALSADRTLPPCVDEPEIYTAVCSGDFVADAKIAWRLA
jgi:hypothetical protein